MPIRFVPGYFANFVFVSVGVVDSGNFKGGDAVDALRDHTQENLDKYVALSRGLGMPATSYWAIGTDAVDELERSAWKSARSFPNRQSLRGSSSFTRRRG